MSHFIEFDGLREKIFILQNLIHSSEEFCVEHAIGVKEFEELYTRNTYFRQLKSIVSNYLLEISVKVRNMDDIVDSNIKNKNDIDYTISTLGDCKKTFRETCNKIIHAKKFILGIESSKKSHEDLWWWSGNVIARGTQMNGKEWEVIISLHDWCDDALAFINGIEPELSKIQTHEQDVQFYS